MTADQLEEGPTENKHDLPGPGKELNGEQELEFDSVAPYRNPDFGEWPSDSSGWTFDKYRD